MFLPRIFGPIATFLRRHKRIAPIAIALAAIPAAIGIQANVANALVWVQQRWDLTTWGSVQTLRDADASNHWAWRWYAPGDGSPTFIVNELWLGAPCNGGVQIFPNNGNGFGGGAAFRVVANQLAGGQYTCIAPQDGRWSGGNPLTESNNTCGSYYGEGWMGSYAPTSVVTSIGIFCNDGNPAKIQIDIGGYNG